MPGCPTHLHLQQARAKFLSCVPALADLQFQKPQGLAIEAQALPGLRQSGLRGPVHAIEGLAQLQGPVEEQGQFLMLCRLPATHGGHWGRLDRCCQSPQEAQGECRHG